MTDQKREDSLKFIQKLEENVRSAESLVGKWTTAKPRKAQLLHEIAHDSVVIGINHFVAGSTSAAHASFVAAMGALERAEGLVPSQSVTYAIVQILAGALCAGDEKRASVTAEAVFRSVSVEHLASAGRTPRDAENLRKGAHGQVALIGWIGACLKDSVAAHAELAVSAEPPMEQFRLWGECTRAGILHQAQELQGALDELAIFAAKERRNGAFRYSEDRHVYLPGLGIVALAGRDGIDVQLPASSQWPRELIARRISN